MILLAENRMEQADKVIKCSIAYRHPLKESDEKPGNNLQRSKNMFAFHPDHSSTRISAKKAQSSNNDARSSYLSLPFLNFRPLLPTILVSSLPEICTRLSAPITLP
jgi:hypothetical protein